MQSALPVPDTAPLSERLASLEDVRHVRLQFGLTAPCPSILAAGVNVDLHMAAHFGLHHTHSIDTDGAGCERRVFASGVFFCFVSYFLDEVLCTLRGGLNAGWGFSTHCYFILGSVGEPLALYIAVESKTIDEFVWCGVDRSMLMAAVDRRLDQQHV